MREAPQGPWQEAWPHLTPCPAHADSAVTIAWAVTDWYPVNYGLLRARPQLTCIHPTHPHCPQEVPGEVPSSSLPLWLGRRRAIQPGVGVGVPCSLESHNQDPRALRISSWINTDTNPHRWGLTCVKHLRPLRDCAIHFLRTTSSPLHFIIFVGDKETEARRGEAP